MSKSKINVTIKNFQGIKHVEFSIEGFTVLIGPSDSCKSAAVRAIDYAWKNKQGSHFLRDENEVCYVKVDIPEDNFCMEWFKSKKESYYIFNNDEENQKYEKLNGAIPQPIIDYGLGILECSNKTSLFPQICSNQHKTLFFISETDSIKTDILTEISETTKISKVRKLLYKDLRNNKILLKNEEKKLDVLLQKNDYISELNLEEKILESKNVFEGFEKKLDSFKCLNKNILDFKKTKLNIDLISGIDNCESFNFNQINKSLKDLNLQLNSYLKILKIRSNIKDMLGLDSIKEYSKKFKDIESNLLRVKNSLTLFKEWKIVKDYLSILDKLNPLDFESNTGIVDSKLKSLLKIVKLINDFTDIKSKLDLLSNTELVSIDMDTSKDLLKDLSVKLNLYKRYKDLNIEISEIDSKISNTSLELKNIQNSLSEFKTCPLCDTELKHEH